MITMMRRGLLLMALVVTNTGTTSGVPEGLNIDPDQVTVSGISAGAQMAHQLHIAFPDVFSGIGIIAGGPFGCADNSLATAMTRCIGSVNAELPLAHFVDEIRSAAVDGKVGDTQVLADDHVWIFHGAKDKAVAVELSDATVTLYQEFVAPENIRYVSDIDAAHTFPTMDMGTDCLSTGAPFIGKCDYDAAGELLQHLYGKLHEPSAGTEAELVQTTLPGAVAAGMSDTAYLFVPAACSSGEQKCKAHLVLHGCAQAAAQVGTVFMEQSGYLPWARSNDIVLAFPQVLPSAINPIACWDWWGYTGADYRWREGAQMKVLTDWIGKLAIH